MFIGSAINEEHSSNQINPSKKNMWTAACIFFPFFAGVIYFSMTGKRITRASS